MWEILPYTDLKSVSLLFFTPLSHLFPLEPQRISNPLSTREPLLYKDHFLFQPYLPLSRL